MGNVRDDVSRLFGDAAKSSNDAVSLEFLDAPHEENYISLGILEKPASLMCEHLSIRALECNVGGFAHLECSNPSFHEKCPFKLLHAELRKRKF